MKSPSSFFYKGKNGDKIEVKVSYTQKHSYASYRINFGSWISCTLDSFNSKAIREGWKEINEIKC
jgi:hypothetical protein